MGGVYVDGRRGVRFCSTEVRSARPTMMNERYRHTQTAWTLIVLIVAVVLTELTIVTFGAPQGTLSLALSGAVVAVAAVMLALFSTLTVIVDDRALRLWFGFGALRREVMLADVTAARKVRNHWFSGWGVRVIPGGRLYNVGGLDAVELEMDGGRVVRVGTDQPDALLAAVTEALDTKGGR
ncbi:MAG TPA: hypothetical protein VIL79_00450 [Thermoleophilia bacterium]